RNCDTPWQSAITFDLAEHEVDARDTAAYWAAYLHKIEDAIASGVVRPAELEVLQARAAELGGALDRFEHDDTTVEILDQLDVAATAKPSLVAIYRPKFADLLANLKTADVLGQRERLRLVLKMVRGTSIEGTDSTLLQDLLDRLSLLYSAPQVGTAAEAQKLA